VRRGAFLSRLAVMEDRLSDRVRAMSDAQLLRLLPPGAEAHFLTISDATLLQIAEGDPEALAWVKQDYERWLDPGLTVDGTWKYM
jgi:hypothetical protein